MINNKKKNEKMMRTIERTGAVNVFTCKHDTKEKASTLTFGRHVEVYVVWKSARAYVTVNGAIRRMVDLEETGDVYSSLISLEKDCLIAERDLQKFEQK